MPDVLQGLLGSAACAAAPPEPASSAAATAPTTDDDNHHEATTGAEAAATAVQDHVQDADAAAAAALDAPDRAAAMVGSLSEDKGCAASESEGMDCTCYVCLEGDDPELTELGELLRGCACRGSAGWAHLRCLVQQATANRQRFQKQQLQSMLTPVRLRDDTQKNIPSLFDQCPTCNQRWTADLALKLARERCALSASVIGRPVGADNQLIKIEQDGVASEVQEDVLESVHASSGLVHALSKSAAELLGRCDGSGDPEQLSLATGLFTEAERLAQELIVTTEAMVVQMPCASTLHAHAMTLLASIYADTGRAEDALPLELRVLAHYRKLFGNNTTETLLVAQNIGVTYGELGQFKAALPYTLEAVNGNRIVRPKDHAETLLSIENLGSLHMSLGDDNAALPLLTEAAEARRRVFGSEHPYTLKSLGDLAVLLSRFGDFDRSTTADELFKEAMLGLIKLYGAQHSDVGYYHRQRQVNQSNLAVMIKQRPQREREQRGQNERQKPGAAILGCTVGLEKAAFNGIVVPVKRYAVCPSSNQEEDTYVIQMPGIERGNPEKGSFSSSTLDRRRWLPQNFLRLLCVCL